MSTRQHLRTLAALVLLVWTFSVGLAFAQACVSKVDLACEGCCTEVKATATFVDGRADALAPAELLPGPPATPVRLADTAFQVAREALRLDTDGPPRPPRIPVVFLRLAL